MASRRSVERRWSWLASEQGARLLEAVEKDEVDEADGDSWVTWVARGPGVPGGSEVIWIARDTRMPGASGKNWNYKLNPEKSAKKKQA